MAAQPPENIRVLKSVAIKDAKASGNRLACYPSVMGNLDLYADVIFPPKKASLPGPFADCLPAFLKRGFNPTDHRWDWTALVAYPIEAEERGNKLYSVCEFHSDQNSQDALLKCKERLAAGLEVGLSIGFSIQADMYLTFINGPELLSYAKKNGWDLALFDVETISRHMTQCWGILKVAELWEYSLTPAPANQAAVAIAIKNAAGPRIYLGASEAPSSGVRPAAARGRTHMMKSICGSKSLGLADEDMKWDASAAIKRVKAHTGAEDEPNDKFAKAFVVVAGPNDEFGSYHLPFADVVDGELKAVPKAIMAVAGALDGARGGVDLSDQDREGAKRFVEAYYKKMGKDVPWADDAGKDGEKKWKGQYLGEYTELAMCSAAMQQAWYGLCNELEDAISGYGDYADMGDDDIYDAIDGMFDEHKTLCMSIIKAIRDNRAEETPEQATLSIRRAVVAQLSSLGDGLTYTKHAKVVVDAARELIDRTKGKLVVRKKEGRVLSEQNRQTLKDASAQLGEVKSDLDQLIAETEPKANADKARELELEFRQLEVMPDLTAA